MTVWDGHDYGWAFRWWWAIFYTACGFILGFATRHAARGGLP